MNNIGILEFIKEDLSNLIQVINPMGVERLFTNLQPYPRRWMLLHNLILGLFMLSGYFLYFRDYSPVKYSLETSLKLGFLYYVIAVSIPMILGLLIYLFSETLLSKKVGLDEGITLASYPVSLGLISGIFRTFTETWVLHILFMLYSMYLIYVLIKTRFGFERAILNFLFLIFLTAIAVMIMWSAGAWILSIQRFYY